VWVVATVIMMSSLLKDSSDGFRRSICTNDRRDCNEILFLYARCWWLNVTKYNVTSSPMFIWTKLGTYTKINTKGNTIIPHYVCSNWWRYSILFFKRSRREYITNVPWKPPILYILRSYILSLSYRYINSLSKRRGVLLSERVDNCT
jgi:hypothetical protein